MHLERGVLLVIEMPLPYSRILLFKNREPPILRLSLKSITQHGLPSLASWVFYKVNPDIKPGAFDGEVSLVTRVNPVDHRYFGNFGPRLS